MAHGVLGRIGRQRIEGDTAPSRIRDNRRQTLRTADGHLSELQSGWRERQVGCGFGGRWYEERRQKRQRYEIESPDNWLGEGHSTISLKVSRQLREGLNGALQLVRSTSRTIDEFARCSRHLDDRQLSQMGEAVVVWKPSHAITVAISAVV